MKLINLTSAYEWQIKTSKEQKAIYHGEFVTINGKPHYIGEKFSGNGPLVVALPSSRDPETGEVYVSASYPPTPDKKHGELDRLFQPFSTPGTPTN